MKKFLALALALVMALALAAPAMAFTDKGVADDYVPELKIELVEYENDTFFGIVGYAPSDRGYAKNEIVAFVVTLEVAKDETIAYDVLKVTGESVKFVETENNQKAGVASNLLVAVGKDLVAKQAAITGKASAQWLGFAKVTGDDASLTATLYVDGDDASVKFNANGELVVVDDEEVEYTVASKTDGFEVSWKDDKKVVHLFGIEVGKKGVSKALYVDGYKVIENKAGEYVFLNAANGDVEPGDKANKALYEELVSHVDDVFEGVFGFEYDLLGGVVDKKYFEGLVDYDKVVASVDIAPWVAYVQVPDVIVVDPPKTGDATVLVGIVMAIVAAAGVVVFNKVRA